MPDKEKKLNLTAIDEMFKVSTINQVFGVSGKAVPGFFGGMGAGTAILGTLAFVGFAAAFWLEIVAAAVGGVIIGAAAIALSISQIKRYKEKVSKLKDDFDEKLRTLQDMLRDIINDYSDIELRIAELDNERIELEGSLQNVDVDVDEQQKQEARSSLVRVNHSLEVMKQSRINCLAQSKALLSFIGGNTEEEKLRNLFSLKQHEDLNSIVTGAHHFCSALSSVTVTPKNLDIVQAKINHEKETKHIGIKKLQMGVAIVSGFFGGMGATTLVAGLVLGGMAAALAVGWPILLAAVGIGIIGAVGSALYLRHVEKQQQKRVQDISLAKAQVTGMTEYGKEYVRKNVKSSKKELQKFADEKGIEDKALMAELSRRVAERIMIINELIKQTKSFVVECKHLLHKESEGMEIGGIHFQSETSSALKKSDKLEEKLKEELILLNNLQRDIRFRKTSVVAVTELLVEVDDAIKRGKESQEKVDKLHAELFQNTHPEVVIAAQPKPDLEEKTPQEKIGSSPENLGKDELVKDNDLQSDSEPPVEKV